MQMKKQWKQILFTQFFLKKKNHTEKKPIHFRREQHLKKY